MPSPDISIDQNPLRQINNICTVYGAKNSEGEKLFVKFIKNNAAKQIGAFDAIDFNRQVLSDIKDFEFPDNFLMIKDDLSNQNLTGFITQPYECSLEDVIKNKKITQKEAMLILSQIVKAAYSLIMAGYWHRNYRPVHFVKVGQLWKIQSLVFTQDYSMANGGINEYLWNPTYQSPQFYISRKFQEEEYNALVVWNIGSILLDMLLGNHKLYNLDVINKFKGQQFTFKKIGISNIVYDRFSEDVHELLGRMLHHNPNKRMTIDEMFECKFISPEVAKKAVEYKKQRPPRKIPSGKGSLRNFKLGALSKLCLKDVEMKMEARQKQQRKLLQSSILEDDDLLGTLRMISNIIPSRQQIVRRQEPEQGSMDPIQEIMQNKNHPVRKALQLYKSYQDQSELLAIAAQVIHQMEFTNITEQKQVKEIKIINKYATIFVSLINLNWLAEGFNQNKNIFELNGDIFSQFQSLGQYSAFQKMVNYKRSQRAKMLQQIRSQMMMLKHKNLITNNQAISNFITKDYKKTSFQDIKLAYRQIVKHAYDNICQQYRLNKKTQKGKKLASVAMYVTYALTIDKLYIKKDIPDNFKLYFQWINKAAIHYVPVQDFKNYIEKSPAQILIAHSRYILYKYYNI